MPNRIIREGILTSERVNELDWEAEVFYRRLMSVVDDFGRYSAHPALLRAALYPLKLETVREASMERQLKNCEQARLIRLYEVDGKRFLEVLNFKQRMRAKHGKWPPPDGHMTVTCPSYDGHMTARGGDGGGDEIPPNPPEGEGVCDPILNLRRSLRFPLPLAGNPEFERLWWDWVAERLHHGDPVSVRRANEALAFLARLPAGQAENSVREAIAGNYKRCCEPKSNGHGYRQAPPPPPPKTLRMEDLA